MRIYDVSAMFHYNNEGRGKEAENMFLPGLEIGPEKVEPRNGIIEVILYNSS